MKKTIATVLLTVAFIFCMGQGRRYSPTFWRAVPGGIQYTAGAISQSTDVYIATKTVIKTFDIDPAGSDDYQFDNTVGNVTEQTIEIASIVPAYAEIVSAQVRCFETVVSSGVDVMAIDVGTSDGGAEILATADTDTANDINATAATVGPEVVATNAARSVWVNATPDANWDTISAGRWSVMVTYIDYGAVQTAKNP